MKLQRVKCGSLADRIFRWAMWGALGVCIVSFVVLYFDGWFLFWAFGWRGN